MHDKHTHKIGRFATYFTEMFEWTYIKKHLDSSRL